MDGYIDGDEFDGDERSQTQGSYESGIQSVVKNGVLRDRMKVNRTMPQDCYNHLNSSKKYKTTKDGDATLTSLSAKFSELKATRRPPWSNPANLVTEEPNAVIPQ